MPISGRYGSSISKPHWQGLRFGRSHLDSSRPGVCANKPEWYTKSKRYASKRYKSKQQPTEPEATEPEVNTAWLLIPFLGGVMLDSWQHNRLPRIAIESVIIGKLIHHGCF